MSLTIFGASDDLVEVEGDIREEFTYPDAERVYLAVSDGTCLRVSYDGRWRIDRVAEGAASYEHVAAESDDGDPRSDEFNTPIYSDRVTLTGMGDLPLSWVVYGTGFAESS